MVKMQRKQFRKEDEITYMERQVKVIGAIRWLSIPLGAVMYLGTVNSFGQLTASVLCLLAAAVFFLLIKSEQGRIIGEFIADDIRDAIKEVDGIESFIEIKRLKSGILARVYLVNAKEKTMVVHKSIRRKLDRCSMKKYLWVMQLTDMPGRDDFEETQQRLNEQLLEEMLRRRRGE